MTAIKLSIRDIDDILAGKIIERSGGPSLKIFLAGPDPIGCIAVNSSQHRTNLEQLQKAYDFLSALPGHISQWKAEDGYLKDFILRGRDQIFPDTGGPA